MRGANVALLWPRWAGERLGLPILRALVETGFRVHVISSGLEFLPIYSRYCHRWRMGPVPTDLRDAVIADAWLDQYCRENEVELIVPGDPPTVRLLASGRLYRNAHRLLPTADLTLIDMLDNKWRFHRLVESEGLPLPRTRLVRDCREVDGALLEEIGFPMLSKPLRLYDCQEIVLLDNESRALSYLKTMAPMSAFPMILQEFIFGVETQVSIAAHSGNIAGATIARMYRDRLEFTDDFGLLSMVSQLVNLTDFTGIAYFEFITDDKSGEQKFIECNPRIPPTVLAATHHGVNLLALMLAQRSSNWAIHMPQYRCGTVFHTKTILQKTLRSPRPLLTDANRQTFWSDVTDPLPFAFRSTAALWRRARYGRSHPRFALS